MAGEKARAFVAFLLLGICLPSISFSSLAFYFTKDKRAAFLGGGAVLAFWYRRLGGIARLKRALWSSSLPIITINPKKKKFLKIVLISDTHSKHKEIEPISGDLLIHAGDFTMHGKPHELKSFVHWLKALDFKEKVVIAGNHDLSLDSTVDLNAWKYSSRDMEKVKEAKELLEEACDHLIVDSREVELRSGGLTLFGSPWSNWINEKRGVYIRCCLYLITTVYSDY